MQKLDPKYFSNFFKFNYSRPLVIKDDFKVLTTEDISDFVMLCLLYSIINTKFN